MWQQQVSVADVLYLLSQADVKGRLCVYCVTYADMFVCMRATQARYDLQMCHTEADLGARKVAVGIKLPLLSTIQSRAWQVCGIPNACLALHVVVTVYTYTPFRHGSTFHQLLWCRSEGISHR